MSDDRTYVAPDDIVAEAERLTRVGVAREIHQMNQRIARRRAETPLGRFVPVSGPRWCSEVRDTGEELVAIHRDTAEPYPLDPHGDLDIEEHAVVVLQRLFLDGATTAEAERVVRAFGLPGYARTRLLRQIREDA